jgi:hypothetical protein
MPLIPPTVHVDRFSKSVMVRLHGLFLVVFLAGCAGLPVSTPRTKAGHCDPPLSYRYDPAFVPREDVEASLTPELLARYSRRNLLSANAVGILPALQKMVTLQSGEHQGSDVARELAVLRQQQLVLTRIVLASSTISSLAAELDCEGERADQMASQLANLDDIRTQRLNVLSITVGALSGIATTVGESRRTQNIAGVGGGLLGSGLGLLTLWQSGHTEEFQHPRNLLTDVWNGNPASSIWPPSVWYMLTHSVFSNFGQTSIANNTRERWKKQGRFENLDASGNVELTALLFGLGGTYSADQLKLRADMLNELQSSVRLLNQELQGLLLAILE